MENSNQKSSSIVDGLIRAGIAFGGALVIGRFLGALLEPDDMPSERRVLSAAECDEIARRDGWCCVYCGVRVTRKTRHIDHAVSLANGGSNDWDNLVTACSACNLSKGSLDADEFLRLADW